MHIPHYATISRSRQPFPFTQTTVLYRKRLYGRIRLKAKTGKIGAWDWKLPLKNSRNMV